MTNFPGIGLLLLSYLHSIILGYQACKFEMTNFPGIGLLLLSYLHSIILGYQACKVRDDKFPWHWFYSRIGCVVAKNHLSIYEALYQQVDPAGTGKVGAIEAATFLKKSGLQDDVLMRIWDLSDPENTGYLTKTGFFTSLKLIALAQNGQEVAMSCIFYPSPPPHMQGTGLDSPAAPIDWSIKLNVQASEKLKYEEMFASLGPINDRLPGAKVKPVMLNSKLPVETLGKIWDLSDIDQDGFLDKEEFMLAMHLIYKALENIPVPSELPPDLVPSSKQRTPGVLPDLLDGPRRASTPSLDSSVSYKNALNKAATPLGTEKAKFDAIFHSLDLDRDGFVTGTDIKSIFLQSGLPAQTLAHI
ncbi:EPS15L1, partial [Cordylochernes scorpioides]